MPKAIPCARATNTGTLRHGRRNPNASGYTYRWQQRAKRFLLRYRWCGDRPLGQPGVLSECYTARQLDPLTGLEASTLVDHVVPHNGDPFLFWDEQGNWQGLCTRCHAIKTRRGL